MNIDLWLNIVAQERPLEVYWNEPTIVFQGSEYNIYNRYYIEYGYGSGKINDYLIKEK